MTIIRPIPVLAAPMAVAALAFLLVGVALCTEMADQMPNRAGTVYSIAAGVAVIAFSVLLGATVRAYFRPIAADHGTIRVPSVLTTRAIPVSEVTEWRWRVSDGPIVGGVLGMVCPEFTTADGRTIRGTHHVCRPHSRRWTEARDAMAKILPGHPGPKPPGRAAG
ncbi:hypothetical protein ORV05_23050 [Amycolatopsis cynarae]|uniref:Uncharacterized protein n=1 Tax=Amycolatopsis cynarae TaxID=2995223 RepID=A0ABY7AV52_9PSEU|nr:hypothetical protein [Amycolatopsis sp. HUAS 11-8]WAL63859.1 hypothetical protein ORV05_23050 [Amycolatopsis sp. HUAS 11-8]